MLWCAPSLNAQKPVAAPKDSTAAPITSDTTRVRRRIVRDTIKAPLAKSELPRNADDRWHWSGEALRAAGAMTLADLIDKVPGATGFRANWIPGAQFVAYNGDAGRIRVFLDGIELDAFDPRNGDMQDLSVLPMWQLEEVSIERAAGELRVHLRSWRVDHVAPFTRTDITTGSDHANLYRGYFGKRLGNGMAIQMAAQQYSTTSPAIVAGDGSSLQIFTRLGWAWKRLSVDGVLNRAKFDRAGTIRWPLATDKTPRIGAPAFKSALSTAYARIAWGDPDAPSRPWIQMLAGTQSIEPNVTGSVAAPPPGAPKDTVDSTWSRTQYAVSAGASRWGFTGSATARLRSYDGRTDFSPAVRLGYQWRFLSVNAFGEQRGNDSTRRVDLSARIAPWRWLQLSGSYGWYHPDAEATRGPVFRASRVELASSLFGVTLSGGMVHRGLTTLAAPIALDSSLKRIGTGAVKGGVFGVRGALYKDFGIDLSGILWESSGAYRPQMDITGSLVLNSSWLNKFPRNNFHVLAVATYHHRKPMFFPDPKGLVGNSTGPTDAVGARLEIRIASGTVFFQSENTFGKPYETAPGYLMPRRLQYYGLRWDYWD